MTDHTNSVHTYAHHHTHAHTSTYTTRAQTCTWSHTRVHPCTYMHTRADLRSFSCMMHTWKRACAHTSRHLHSHHILTGGHSCIHTTGPCTHATRSCMHAHTCTHPQPSQGSDGHAFPFSAKSTARPRRTLPTCQILSSNSLHPCLPPPCLPYSDREQAVPSS